jgi:endoglucanase
MTETFEMLKKLSEAHGPTGREHQIQEIVAEFLEGTCDTIRRDKLGNLVATMEGGQNKHYAIVAHADEVGFLISQIEEKGFLRVKWNTKGHMPDLRLLPGQWVLIMSEKGLVPGVFCVKTAHIAGPKGKSRIPTYEEIFLDIGATSAEEIIEQGIHIGDPVVYAAPLEKLGHFVSGKSMDDRVGLTTMLRVAAELKGIPKKSRPTVSFISTVQEEMGAKGAATVAKDFDVDAVIAVDIGLADDHPGTKGEAGVGLGLGPVLVVKDSAIHYAHDLIKQLVQVAEREDIPVQRAVYHNYLTDGLQFAIQGQLVAVVAIPCRYSHSSFETLSLKDVEMAIQLILSFVQG